MARLLAGVWFLAASACATTSTLASGPVFPEDALARLQAACERGRSGACVEWGDLLVERGEPLQAELAYARACDSGQVWSCLTVGQMLADRGEFEVAERALGKAAEQEFEEAYEALAELHEARGGPGDLERAARLRWDAPAIDKPVLEVVVGYRAGFPEGLGSELALNFQPMLLLSRRLSLGMHGVTSSGSVVELNGFIGYQHHVSTWVVPYARVLLGSATDARRANRLNFGGEAGLKLCVGPLGHVYASAGSTRASPFHVTVGFGFNALLLLFAR